MSASNPSNELWYDCPASSWDEALPLGNGRIGCMVHGRTTTELLCLNENSVWYGGPQSRLPKDAFRHLPRLREYIRQGRHGDAEKLVSRAFLASPWSQRHYEPLGNVLLEFGHEAARVARYRRSLDVETGVAKVEYDFGDARVVREMFASSPDDVLVLRIQATQPIEFVIRLTRLSDKEYETNEFLDSVEVKDGRLVMFVTPGGHDSIRGCCALGLKVDEQSSVERLNNTLLVTAKETVVVISAHTTFRHADFASLALSDIAAALSRTSDLFARHASDYRALYQRMHLSLGPPQSTDILPTNRRLLHPATPNLTALFTNYSRYLLLSSSRPSSLPNLDLPATLQGLWNNSLAPAWGCRYTININTQMNYWPAGPSNLSVCEQPLFSLLKRMAVKGATTAREMYGCGGWCAHHNTDIWADTDVVDRWMPSALWPLGGAWLCLHIWEHYLFTLDRAFLTSMYEVLSGAVEFCLDFLIESEDGQWKLTSPSLSPENTFIDAQTGQAGIFCEGSAIDTAIVRALLQHFLAATTELRNDDDDDDGGGGSGGPPSSAPALLLAHRATQTLPRLPPPSIIPATGLVREWSPTADHAALDPGHRHLSHLLDLYPLAALTPARTPALASAAAATLHARTAAGGGHTGWSRAWLAGLWARLRDGGQVGAHTATLLRAAAAGDGGGGGGSALPNLLSSHPPFQIDGNFGGGAAVLEAVVQSHEVDGRGRRVVRVLPASPWGEGRVVGARCRGGWEVSFAWRDGVVVGGVEVFGIGGVDGERGGVTGSEGNRKTVLVLPNGREIEMRERGRHVVGL
ncbi:hypothetical protein MBLNU459_g2534t1 [Dothideomycetes sp. NU459]